MRARFQTVQHKLASLPVIRWGLWREKRWQYTTLWSTSTWIISYFVLHYANHRWGYGWYILGGLNVFWDVVTFFANKKYKHFFGDCRVSLASSGSLTLAVTVFFFISHKATLIILATVVGVGVQTAQYILAGIGVFENPVRYLYNKHVAFAERQSKTELA